MKTYLIVIVMLLTAVLTCEFIQLYETARRGSGDKHVHVDVPRELPVVWNGKFMGYIISHQAKADSIVCEFKQAQ